MNERIEALEKALEILRNARLAAYRACNEVGLRKCIHAENALNQQLSEMIAD